MEFTLIKEQNENKQKIIGKYDKDVEMMYFHVILDGIDSLSTLISDLIYLLYPIYDTADNI